MPHDSAFLWINKTAESSHLSRSEHEERLRLFSQAQRISRKSRRRALQATQLPYRSTVTFDEDSRLERNLQENDESGCGFQEPRDTSRSTTTLSIAVQRSQLLNRTGRPVCGIMNSLPRDTSWKSKEIRSVAFYRNVTLGKITTVLEDHRFWEDTVLRLAESHAEVRHLVVAIASTHELLYQADTYDLDRFAVVQCNKAVTLLQALKGWHPTLVLVSCILISALSILRCDLAQAEKTLESGSKIMEMVKSTQSNGQSPEHLMQFGNILSRLSTQHGYKLWAPDIAFRFELVGAASADLVIDTNCVKGPLIDAEHAKRVHGVIMLEVVTKIMRNLARGAHIEPTSPFAQEMLNQLSLYSFYWQSLYNSLPVDREDERMQLKQVRIAFNVGCVIFLTKIINPVELYLDAQHRICDSTFDLVEEILLLRHDGHSLTHLDRFVNGIIFTLGLSCGNRTRRERAIRLLHSQSSGDQGFLNWVRATVVDVMMRLENQIFEDYDGHNTTKRNPRFQIDGCFYNGSCQTVRVEYTLVEKGSTMQASDIPVNCSSWPGPSFTADEVNSCLQGIITAYRIYKKPHASKAPRGYVYAMYHLGRQIPVRWNLNTDYS